MGELFSFVISVSISFSSAMATNHSFISKLTLPYIQNIHFSTNTLTSCSSLRCINQKAKCVQHYTSHILHEPTSFIFILAYNTNHGTQLFLNNLKLSTNTRRSWRQLQITVILFTHIIVLIVLTRNILINNLQCGSHKSPASLQALSLSLTKSSQSFNSSEIA